ncbi:FAD:protein FMN transferase [Marinicella meishanensis]|uniref:FAD:protein FMN transferase n=1 Tax=Marinicella meishanensis TaxID=2873263 RepID=UPI001CC0D1DB|nr:FAD:protein FMN transferase [Marinicella sp. NBU2979]
MKKALFTVCFCWLMAGCESINLTPTKHQLFVFGTLVELNLWHDDPAQSQAAIEQISDTFNAMHHQWHAWKPGRLDDINQALRQGQTVTLTAEELSFLQQTRDLAVQSDHLFNPVIGELVNLWGFHTDDYPILTPPPETDEIQALVSQQLTVDDLHFNGQQLSSDNPRVWLDFGGIAKGYAVDQAMSLLRQHGINNAIVNAGGDLRSMGDKGKNPWRIAIQSPTDWSMVAELTIDGDEAVFTSGNYQRYKAFDGQRYSHIIHPKTGMPVAEIVSATVISGSGIQADAAATALVVAGSDQWHATAQKMGIEEALIITGELSCQATKKMLNRLQNLTLNCQVVD